MPARYFVVTDNPQMLANGYWPRCSHSMRGGHRTLIGAAECCRTMKGSGWRIAGQEHATKLAHAARSAAELRKLMDSAGLLVQ